MENSANWFSLAGRTAVVTGGSGFLAGAMAEAFLSAGAKVSLWSRSPEKLAGARERLLARGAGGGEVGMEAADCGNPAEVERAFERAASTLGVPSILVNNAGGNHSRAPLTEQDLPAFRDVLELNLVAGWLIPTQVFARRWIAAGLRGTCVINVASLTAYKSLPTSWAYSAAKAGVKNLTRGAAKELAPHGIRVNSLSPGFILSGQNEALLLESREPFRLSARGGQVVSRTPMGRLGQADDLKGTMVFLASEQAAGFVTGVDIPVDGGFLCDNI
ncbi:MAG: SDR family oxidoreductase [Planctomycetota bacterium]|jgi:NAD(P)-dependent dehydrogenase (short-subunit alcohol dehydrogenase family)|nr:SDR family oxidoreductase [Planctomycetota bacterium]